MKLTCRIPPGCLTTTYLRNKPVAHVHDLNDAHVLFLTLESLDLVIILRFKIYPPCFSY